MTQPQALMEAVSANLNWFLQPIGENLAKPQKKFLRDGLMGLLRAGRTVAREGQSGSLSQANLDSSGVRIRMGRRTPFLEETKEARCPATNPRVKGMVG
jgi:hypothetical protein